MPLPIGLDSDPRRRRLQRRTARMRKRAHDATPEPCPYAGGGVCRLDARKHYHYGPEPSEVVPIGSDRDRELKFRARADYLRQGLIAHDALAYTVMHLGDR
jgi:hypothetical protein